MRTVSSPQRGKTVARKPSPSASCSTAATVLAVVWPLANSSLALTDIRALSPGEATCSPGWVAEHERAPVEGACRCSTQELRIVSPALRDRLGSRRRLAATYG